MFLRLAKRRYLLVRDGLFSICPAGAEKARVMISPARAETSSNPLDMYGI